MVGEKFGKWTVLRGPILEPNSRHLQWQCQCECGYKGFVREIVLLTKPNPKCHSCSVIEGNKNRSLGIPQPNKQKLKTPKVKKRTLKDLTIGTKSGELTVIELLPHIKIRDQFFCICECSCGNKGKFTRAGILIGKHKKCIKCLGAKRSKGKFFKNAQFGCWAIINDKPLVTSSDTYYICKCNCGAEGSVPKKVLLSINKYCSRCSPTYCANRLDTAYQKLMDEL
jgi:hypothetical protein